MKLKHKIIVEILIVILAVAVFIYNFLIHREIAYMASVVAVCGAIALVVRDIIKLRNGK